MNLINLRYEVKKFLGSGNYGLTYLVYDRKTDEEIALKISDINASSRKVVSQLIQQFYTLKSINNPFIIKPFILEKIFNIDNNPFERDIWFYTMPYISNSTSIDIFIKQHENKPEKILKLCSELIYAINFLHQFEISHNDIQKQNILVNKDEMPILLDIFPARISKYQYYEDFKQLFNLVRNSLSEKGKKIPQIIEDFFNFSSENQFDYSLMRSWLFENAKIKNQHLYFFKGNKITSVSSFNLHDYFEKIKERLSANNIILWEDKDSLDSLKDNFYAYLKVKLQNVVYLKDQEDFYIYLSFKSGQKISNIKEAENFLNSSFLLEPIYFIFDNYLLFSKEEKNILINLSRSYKDKIFLIRFDIFENETDSNWKYHTIYIDESKIKSVLSLAFNWYNFDFSKFQFSFSVSILFNFLSFIKKNLEYFKTNLNEFYLSKTKIAKIRDMFLDFITKIYKIDSLTDDEKKACIVFLSFQKPVPVKLFSEIDFYKVKKTTYLELINKKILRYYKNIDSLGIYEKTIKEIIEKTIKEEDISFYIKFQNYLYENWGISIDDKKNYIKNLKYLKSNKLYDEVLIFYQKFSIFTYYPDYNEVYDLIFILEPENGDESYCKAFADYFYYSVSTLDLKKLKKLQQKILKIKKCIANKEEVKEKFNLAISLIIAGIQYDMKLVEEKAEEAKKYIEDPLISLILFYTYANLLGWIEEGREIQKYILQNLDIYSNIEYYMFLYALAALEKYGLQRESKELEDYYILMSIIYNDSKEENNWVFYLKAAHNIAVYYSSKEGEENKEKAIIYTKESIYYNEQFKIYATLIISYSNLFIDYFQKHRKHPEALNYLIKLEKIADEAFVKNAIEDEQYLFAFTKIFGYYVESWELSKANKYIKKVEEASLQISKYPLYYEYLAYKGIYLLRVGQTEEAYKILNLMENLYDEKLYVDYIHLYYSLGFDIFFYLDDIKILKKLEDKVLKLDKNKIESITIDHDVNYLYNCIIFNRKLKESLKDKLLGKNYKFKSHKKVENFYKIYNYLEKFDKEENNQILKQELLNIVNDSRYTGDIFYCFCDNFIAYLISKNHEYLVNALLNAKLMYSKLTEKERKIFKSSTIIRRFLSINSSFSFYLSHDKSFNSYIEKSSESINLSFEIINRIFDRFKNSLEDDIENMFKYLLKFLIHFGYCTYCAIYKVDETYTVKLVQSYEKNGFQRFSQDYFERCFKIFLTQSSPFIIKSVSMDGLKPHVFVAIPILDYTGQITRKDSSSVYKFDEYSFFLIFETQYLINPYWSITGEFATFLENFLSFLNNQYFLAQENMYDPLTKVLVRNNFLTKLKNALSKVKSGTLLFIDIDNFKSINDIYSHDFGDKVLTKVASTIKNSVRKVDIVGRYGGEEFLVFIPIISEDSAKLIAERIRINVMNEKIINEQIVTVTIGLSYYPDDSIFSDILISKAEIANRYGKLSGKNRIIVYNNKISIESFSKQYINGLIVRDPIKTSENAKILIEILELASSNKDNFNHKLEKGFNLIQKAIQFDYYLVLERNKPLISNDFNIFEEFMEKTSQLNQVGLIGLKGSIFNYCISTHKNYLLCIGNFKNFVYLQEHNTLFQLYCNTLFLSEKE